MSGALTRGAIASAFVRSFLIQGSWNTHTMLGSGFAFAMLPGLRSLFGAEPKAMDESVERHLELFNAHPYMSNVALGAALRLEADGADPETIRRFKVAVGGPLGSLGDALVWATWLPGVSAFALALYWLGLPWWLAAVFFMVLYNVGHLGLRVWGFRLGLNEGRDVGRRLGTADLRGWTTRLKGVAALALGLMVGAVLGSDAGLVAAGDLGLWVALAGGGFLAGLLVGHRAWRPAAAAVVAAIALLSIQGLFR